MATRLIDDAAAVDLVSRVFRQARKDIVRKCVHPEDRISAVELLLVYGGFADGDEYDNTDIGDEGCQPIQLARRCSIAGAEVA